MVKFFVVVVPKVNNDEGEHPALKRMFVNSQRLPLLFRTLGWSSQHYPWEDF